MATIREELYDGIRTNGKELTKADVGKMIDESFGPVLATDVGKRLWIREYGIAMENDEQRDKRLLKEKDEYKS